MARSKTWHAPDTYYARNRDRLLAKANARNAIRRGAAPHREKPEACEVCAARATLVWDHCHQTGKFRGWLCNPCNLALGHARDSPTLLKALADYVERHSSLEASDTVGHT